MPSAARRAKDGGADEIRTRDPLLAKQVLYQLSYDPSVEKYRERTVFEIYFVRSTGTQTSALSLAAPGIRPSTIGFISPE